MKKTQILFLVGLWAFLPSRGFAETQSTLFMNVTRVHGNALSVSLSDADDFVGPLFNLSTGRILFGTLSVLRTNIQEIRFEVKDVEVPDGITEVEADECEGRPSDTFVYTLQGVRIPTEKAVKGIYIKNGKKYIRK